MHYLCGGESARQQGAPSPRPRAHRRPAKTEGLAQRPSPPPERPKETKERAPRPPIKARHNASAARSRTDAPAAIDGARG